MSTGTGNLRFEDVLRIHRIAQRHLLTASRRQLSMPAAYAVLLHKYYRHRDRDGYPSFDQFRRIVRPLMSSPSARALRLGRIGFAQNTRSAIHRPGQELPGPGTYQIDATELPLIAVAEWDRRQPLGRPVVYVVRDWWSGAYAGLYVSLSKPSHAIAARALMCAVMRKVDLCRHFGISITEIDWSISGLPSMLITDRGEMIGTVPTGWVDRLQLTLVTLPVRRPDWKGLIEIAMRIIQERGLAVAPGALTQAQRDRGLKASEPALTLTDVWRVLLLTLQILNAQTVKTENLPPDAIRYGHPPFTPMSLYAWGQEQYGILPRAADDEWIRLRLFPHHPVSSSTRTFFLNRLRYNAGPALDAELSLRGTGEKPKMFMSAVNPLNAAEAYIIHPRTGKYVPLTLLGAHRAYAGLSVEEAKAFHQVLKAYERDHDDSTIWDRLDKQAEIIALLNKRRRADRFVFGESAPLDRLPAPLTASASTTVDLDPLEEVFRDAAALLGSGSIADM